MPRRLVRLHKPMEADPPARTCDHSKGGREAETHDLIFTQAVIPPKSER